MALPLTPEEIQGYLQGPSLAPPNEETIPNFENPPRNNAVAYWVTGGGLVLASIVVFIRIYVKAFRTKQVKLEDICGLLSYAFYIAHAWSIFALCNRVGYFVHQWDVQLQYFGTWLSLIDILRTFYFLAIGFAKNAILLEWKRIFVPHPTRNAFYWTCWALVIVNTLYYTTAIILTHEYCRPFEKAWEFWLEGYCLDQWMADVIIHSFNLFTDLVILILPQRVIWRLQMRQARRVGISFLFSLGLLTLSCAVGRLHSVIGIDYSGDVIYAVYTLILWGVGELTGLLFVFCIPVIPKAFEGGRELLSKVGRSLRSWPSSTKINGASFHSRAPPRQRPVEVDVYERMTEESSQVELTNVKRI